MLDCLPTDLPIYYKDRIEFYKKHNIPETVYKDLDAQVLHMALHAKYPGSKSW